ncbi:adenine phosphoribosyltransferase [Gemmatimonadota bacterium]
MPSETLTRLYDSIRDVPDFPEPGIVFKDITPLLLDPELLELAIESLADPVKGLEIDRVMGIESRGFIFGAPLAMRLGAGLVLARKAGKLPWKTRRVEYALEYGTDAIEVHTDAIESGHRVLVVDDLLATGGTASAAADIVSDAGAELVGFSFLVELAFLNGREKLPDSPVFSLLKYPRGD